MKKIIALIIASLIPLWLISIAITSALGYDTAANVLVFIPIALILLGALIAFCILIYVSVLDEIE